MSTPENGTYATRAELNAHLTPMKSDIAEIKADVKSLLLARAGSSAVADRRRFFSDRVLATGALIVALGSSLAAWIH